MRAPICMSIPDVGVLLKADPTMVFKTHQRVRGGHLNRWLIRVEVLVPRPFVRVDHLEGVLYAHPDMFPAVLAQLRATGGGK